jgi:hypothetical protein
MQSRDFILSRIQKVVSDIQKTLDCNRSHIAQQLDISLSSLNKKLRGDAPWLFREITKLMELNHSFSIDATVRNTQYSSQVRLSTKHTPIHHPIAYVNLLQDLLERKEPLADTKIQYLSRDVPIFYYFAKPMLTKFVFSVFSKHIWKTPGAKRQSRFDTDQFSPFFEKSIRNIWESYQKIDSVEIWRPDVWCTILMQLKYYHDIQWVDQENTRHILNDMRHLIFSIKQMVANGFKGSDKSGSLSMYANYIAPTNNLIMAENNGYILDFIAHDNPNFLFTRDNELTKLNRAYFDELKENSIFLNKSRNRDPFFDKMESYITFHFPDY